VSYRISEDEWDLLAMIQKVLAVCNSTSRARIYTSYVCQAAANVQEAFSAEYYPTVWRILPLYEDFIAQWRALAEDPKMAILELAINAGIESVEKYYNKTDNSPAHIVSMCSLHLTIHICFPLELNLGPRSQSWHQGRVFQCCLDERWSTTSLHHHGKSGIS
jgi:hypothetical protein